jgi:3-hydroxyacyl-CoA dehydrogenase
VGNINAVTDLQIDNEIGIVAVDSPPVNALSVRVREGLYLAFQQALDDPIVKAVILICEGRTFFAGADISEFGRPAEGPSFEAVTTRIENSPKPVVAAIHGTALGGGLEVALTCHYRVAVPSAKVGLPEVNLGILPGAGGTQRLPRIVGVDAALDIITSGRAVPAPEACQLAIIDELVEEGHLRRHAIAYTRRLVDQRRPARKVRDLSDKIDAARGKPEVFAEFRRAHAFAFRGFKAPEGIIKSIEAAVNLPFAEGLKQERALFQELVNTLESKAQRYAFFAEREVAKLPDVSSQTRTMPIQAVGIVGAGVMGRSMAIRHLDLGLPVTLVDIDQRTLDLAAADLRKAYSAIAERGRITAADVDERLASLKLAIGLDALSNCDLVIEAVFEDLEVKRRVFRELDERVRADAILATTTSFLDIEAIATATRRPERVVGLHRVELTNVSRLMEVVRGEKTSNEVIATAMQLARKIGNVAVLSRGGHGFIANRAMQPCLEVANALVLEGTVPRDIDHALVEFGFPRGPLSMRDPVGLDATRCNPSNLSLAVEHDLRPRQYTQAELVELLLYPVVNEGAKILEEGIARRAAEIDISLLHGFGWPIFTGGPMFWANTVGLARTVERLKAFEAERGETFKPSALLQKLAAAGKTFHEQ